MEYNHSYKTGSRGQRMQDLNCRLWTPEQRELQRRIQQALVL